jgi:hypothetical protein
MRLAGRWVGGGIHIKEGSRADLTGGGSELHHGTLIVNNATTATPSNLSGEGAVGDIDVESCAYLVTLLQSCVVVDDAVRAQRLLEQLSARLAVPVATTNSTRSSTHATPIWSVMTRALFLALADKGWLRLADRGDDERTLQTTTSTTSTTVEMSASAATTNTAGTVEATTAREALLQHYG